MDTLDRIKSLCAQKGITVQKLERDIGEKQSSIFKANSNMKAEKLYKIAQYFNVSMESIIGKPDIMQRHNLSFEDQDILEAYHKASEDTQKAVRAVLQVKKDSQLYKEA